MHHYLKISLCVNIILFISVVYYYNRQINRRNTFDENAIGEWPLIQNETIITIEPSNNNNNQISILHQPQHQQSYRLKNSSTLPQFTLYIHPPVDIVSDDFYRFGYFRDCLVVMQIIEKHFEGKRIVIVDIGTNIGTCAFLFASRGHKVYGFEPLPSNYELFQKSLLLNYNILGEIILITAGAHNKKDISHIYSDPDNIGNSIVSEDLKKLQSNPLLGNFPTKDNRRLPQLTSPNKKIIDTNVMIRLTLIDSVVQEHVHLIKLDCQGHEIYAIMGAKRLFDIYGIDVVYFEYSPPWIRVRNQDPIDLLLFFHLNNFIIYDRNNKEIKREYFKHFTLTVERSHAGFTDLLCIKHA